MDNLHPIVALALSLGIGLIIGTERGWQLRDEPSGNRVAGLRTYAIVGVIGGVVVGMTSVGSGSLIIVGLLLLAAVLLDRLRGKASTRHGVEDTLAAGGRDRRRARGRLA